MSPCNFSVRPAKGTYSFGAEWNVRPTPALIEELEKVAGQGPDRRALQPAARERGRDLHQRLAGG
jgi:hypothetical protein